MHSPNAITQMEYIEGNRNPKNQTTMQIVNPLIS
jgi:hypothetical protein